MPHAQTLSRADHSETATLAGSLKDKRRTLSRSVTNGLVTVAPRLLLANVERRDSACGKIDFDDGFRLACKSAGCSCT